MKKTLVAGILVVLILGTVLACSSTRDQCISRGVDPIATADTVGKEHIPPARGFSVLHIDFSVKTHKPGMGFMNDAHGKPEYRVHVTIDGQTTLLQGILFEENSEANGLADPEAGDGIRYRFRESFRLEAGTHRIAVAIPEDSIAVERDVTLADGNASSLVIEPLYGTTPGKRCPGAFNTTSFKQGIRGVRLLLDGRTL